MVKQLDVQELTKTEGGRRKVSKAGRAYNSGYRSGKVVQHGAVFAATLFALGLSAGL